MSYVILCDSCTDFTSEMESDPHFVRIPLTLSVGGVEIIDDETFDQVDFLRRVEESPECPKSSCPSPEQFLGYFESADDVYVVTLSSRLSGSYNSAELAKKMYLESHPGKNIFVFDSKSASAGQTLQAQEIRKRAEKGMPFKQLISEVTNYIDTMGTKFVLETLEMLRKNGRLSSVTAAIINALNVKLVMSSDGQGMIQKVTQARGMKKAIMKMVSAIASDAVDAKNRILCISHCNNEKRAEFVKNAVAELQLFKDIIVTKAGGVSSLYAADGGIVVAY